MSTPTAVPAENTQAIQGLEPAALWKHFAILSSIPRPSKQETAVLEYIRSVAAQYKLNVQQDAVGNLVIHVPGVGQGVDAPAVIIQGHVDMVTEKNTATVHDFTKDPILLETVSKKASEGSETWLTAKGTTLGADNGIGVAAALALLEESMSNTESALNLPPLELLFTVDEETGLTGATQLDAAALGLTGKTMLNLDTEEWGELYVGCAGGGESVLTLDVTREEATTTDKETLALVELRVEGLLGGHSGINIHEGRANAVLLCAAAIRAIFETQPDAALISWVGGDKHNAIPREARAVLKIPESARDAVQATVKASMEAAKAEYGLLETKLNMELLDFQDDESCSAAASITPESARRLVAMLTSLPYGALKYSHAMPELVETSNNVASINLSSTDDQAVILCSTRSSVSPALEATRNRLEAVASLAGARMERSEAYPGWNPNLDSPLLEIAQILLQRQLGHPAGVKAIHAGLECGLLIEKLGGNVDALSFGPTITGAHSPDESILVDTVPPFYQLVKDILAELATKEKSA